MDDPEDEEVEPSEVPKYLDLSDDVTPVIMGDIPEWCSDADAHILFILNSGLTLTPSIIAENTDISRVTVSRRLNTLQAGGLVEKVGRGKYQITPEGSFVVTDDPEVFEQGAEE